jgi:invasion protein IalB
MKRIPAALLSLAFAASSAFGQTAPAAKPEVETHSDWLTRCFPIQSAAPCDALIALLNAKTKQKILSISLAYAPARDQYVMQLAVPLAVSIPDGVVIAAPGYRSGALFLRRCDRGGCYVELAVSPELVSGLKAASPADATVNVKTPDGKPVAIKVSLKGFGDAIDSMVAKAREKAGSAPAGGTP